jgi:hypothetical protein
LIGNFPLYYKNTIPLFLALILLIILVILEARLGWFERFRRWAKPPQYNTLQIPLHAKFLAALTLWLLAVPVIIGACIFIVALAMTAFVIPWSALGHQEAEAECQLAAKTWPLVTFTGDERVAIDKHAAPTARELLCGTDSCALIRDGATFVVLRTAVQRADAMPIADRESLLWPAKKAPPVPAQETLCYRPPLKPASN